MPQWRLIRHLGSLAAALALAAGLLAPTAPRAAEAGEGILDLADVGEAVNGLAEIADFFATLAENDPNRHAAATWATRYRTYSGAAVDLADLLTRGHILVAELPGDEASRLDRGRLLLDRDLGGQWQPAVVRNIRRTSGDDWPFASRLSTVLLQAQLGRKPEAMAEWMADQRRGSALDLPARAGDGFLVRYWHIKDKYFWMSMSASADPGSTASSVEEARTALLHAEFLAAARDVGKAFGTSFEAALKGEWRDYERSVTGFASARAWLATPTSRASARGPAGRLEAAVALAKDGGSDAADRQAPRPVVLQSPSLSEAAAGDSAPAGEAAAQPAAVARGAEAESRLAALRDALEERGGDLARLESQAAGLKAALAETLVSRDRLAAQVESGRDEMALLQESLSERDAEIARLGEDRARDAEAGRATVAALQAEIADERRAFEARLAELDRSHAAARLADEQTMAALREGIDQERRTADEALESLEARLASDLEASRQTVAALRRELEDDRDRRRAETESVAERELALLAQLDESRVALAETEQRLTAALQLDRRRIEQLGERLAEQAEAASGRLPPGPVAVGGGALILLLLVLTGTVIALRRQIVQLREAPAGRPVPAAPPAPAPAPAPPAARQADEAKPATSPQSLVEALRQGKIGVFEQRLAAMAALRQDQVRDMAREPKGEHLAVLCRALGIDKLGFASVFLLSRKALEGGDEVEPRSLSAAMAVYDAASDGQAEERLAAWRAEAKKSAMVDRLMALDPGVPGDDETDGTRKPDDSPETDKS